MNRIRPKRLRSLPFGLLIAAGFVAAPASAQTPPPASPPADSPTRDAKVHGTITVDFETVTIAELLKLVSVVENVDGVIHIVSSRPGDDAFLVSGSRGAVALSRPDSPNAPSLVLSPARRSAPPHPLAAIGPAPRSAPEFPRLAALGRWLGMGRTPAADHAPAVAAVPRSGPRQPVVEAVGSTESIGLETLPPTGSTVNLDVGSSLGALADGEQKPVGPVHSPWPTPTEPTPVQASRPSHDPAVSRTGHVVQAPRKSPSEHRVAAPGESFEELARRFYGDSRYAWALWWANRDRVAWPDALTPGKSILVPAIGELEPRMVMTEASRRSAPSPSATTADQGKPRRDPDVVRAGGVAPTAAAPGTAGQDSGGFAIHVVRPDDTLRIIAREKCGDERKALEIIALNRDVLTPEGRPRVGQRLILPASPSPAAPSP